MLTTFELTRQLVSHDSITPDDKGCQDLLSELLNSAGFTTETMHANDVKNVWIRRGTKQPLFCFAGHTDVVPTGPLENWDSHPFKPEVRDGLLYGRGTADMKGSVAAMTVAVKRFISDYPNHKGSIAFLMTSDEEGPATDGTIKVINTLEARDEKIKWCLVGEPSSTKQLGDVIKNGRRGSLGGSLTIKGKQGHVAYPHLASNPIHLAAPFISELNSMQWDEGNEFFPPTTFQISNLNSGTGATNVIPSELEMIFNFRFSTEVTADELQQAVETLLKKHNLDYQLTWNLSGKPFLTAEGELVSAAITAIQQEANIAPELSTSGGTSDGRFIAPTGAQVLELGPLNATIHQANECVNIKDLDTLEKIYYQILVELLAKNL